MSVTSYPTVYTHTHAHQVSDDGRHPMKDTVTSDLKYTSLCACVRACPSIEVRGIIT